MADRIPLLSYFTLHLATSWWTGKNGRQKMTWGSRVFLILAVILACIVFEVRISRVASPFSKLSHTHLQYEAGQRLQWRVRRLVGLLRRVFFGQSFWLVKDSTVAVLVTMLMFIWPRSLSDPKLAPILTWEHMKTKYSWSCTLLIGSGFALASHGVSSSGLGDLLACRMNEVFLHMNKFWLQFLATLTVCFATEFASNVATAGIFIPIMLSLSKGLGLHPLYLVLPVTISCSFAFMFPQATPGNAVVVDTKIVSFLKMMSVGFVLNIICVWLTVLNYNTYAYWLMQLGHIPPAVKAVNSQLNCGPANVTSG